MKKRIIAFLLTVCLIFTVVPVHVFAAGQVADGTATSAWDRAVMQANTAAYSKDPIEPNGMYTITWKDCYDRVLATTTHAYGDIITADMAPFVEIEEPELDEVTFWYVEGSGGPMGPTQISFPYAVTHDDCFVAAVGGKTFNATVIYGNGQANGTVAYMTSAPVFVISNSLPVPEYPGHTFMGWEFKDALTGEVIDGLPRTANLVITAKWDTPTEQTYTITWKDCYNRVLATTTHAYGDILTADMAPFVEIEEPELDEVTFWYVEGSGGPMGPTQISFPYAVTHDDCFVAAVGGKTFNATVIYGNGQANGTVAYMTSAPVFVISNSLPVPEYPGHTFMGWEFKDALTGEVIDGLPRTANLVITAKWDTPTEQTYTITWWLDNSFRNSVVRTYTSGTVITADMAPAVSPANDGMDPELFEFRGWWQSGMMGQQIIFPYTITSNQEFVPGFGGKQFTATIVYGNGQADGQYTYACGVPTFILDMELTVPQYEGHSFRGWVYTDGVTGQVITDEVFTANLVITAMWEDMTNKTHNITWLLADGVVEETYHYGDVITADMVPQVTPDEFGYDPAFYELRGWWQTGPYGQQIIFPYTVKGAGQFEPFFGGKSYTATVVYGNGQKNGEYDYVYGKPIFAFELPTPEYENHTFIGWEYADAVTGQVIAVSVPGDFIVNEVLTANLVITAKWNCNHESQFKVEEMDAVPENLESVYESVEEIAEAMTSGTVEVYEDILEEMGVTVEDMVSILQEVTLAYQDADGNWVEADEEHFPDDGKLVVELIVPAGTNHKDYTFFVSHMFTTDAFGKTVGEIEYPEVETFTRDGHDYIRFTVTGLSPITISYVLNPASDVILGDVNGDGEVDTTDAYFIVMYYNEMMDLTEEQLLAADVNGDEEVDTTDAYYIVMFYNEMIDAFPAEQ